MGLKENFSQAVKELTGNTKEDDKKRNAQVAGLKKALDNDPSFSANDRYTEETGRLYYRDEADQYNDRGDGYRQGNTRDGGRPISDSDGYRAGRDRYNDNTNRDYSRERNDGYRNRSDYREYADSRNGGYNDAPRRDDNYGVRNYDSQPTDGRNDNYDRSYDSGRQDRYGDYPYDDRGYNGQTYADDRGDVYTRQGSNAPDEERQNDVQGGYGGALRDGYNSSQSAYGNAPQSGYNNNQEESFDSRAYDGRQSDGYDRRDNRNVSGASERNYNVRSFNNNQQRYDPRERQQPQNGDGRRPSYPIGNVSQRDYRDAPDNELTVISRNTIIDGNVRSFANMSIDGDVRGDVETTKDIELNGRIIGDIICSNANMMVSQVQGNIQLKGDVEIGRDTLLIGDLNSGFAKINGKVKGNVEVTGKAEFKADAVVFGDISASTITVDDGAIIQGYVSTTFLNKEESERIFPESIEIGDY